MQKGMTSIVLFILFACIATTAIAKEKQKNKPQDSAKELSGITIMGNKEAPKSLFIIPWKSSELGVEAGLSSNLLNEKLEVIDKDVFERELDFYSETVTE